MHDLLSAPAADPKLWLLNPKVTFLNHGSFGACPKPILAFQDRIRARLERDPIQFLVRELERELDHARQAVARFVNADPDGIVFVNNATSGVNTVLRSLRFKKGEELLVTDQAYNACRNALEFTAKTWGAKVVVAKMPFPFRKECELIDPLIEGMTARTRLLMIDHVTSQTGVILPIGKIITQARRRGIEVLIDGAHAPGMVPVNLKKLKPTYYTGNCHKWICGPKTAAFLYVDRSRRDSIHPLTISHGITSPRQDRSRFLIEFGWVGTYDPSAVLSVPEALRYMPTLMQGGWSAIMERNRNLAVAGRRLICETLGIESPCPEEYLGSMASIPLPDTAPAEKILPPLYLDPLQDELLEKYKIEAPIVPWPSRPKRLIRISSQLYNSTSDYEKLAHALKKRFC